MQSYELCARKDGLVGRMPYIPFVKRSHAVVVQALETLSQDGDGKARGYLCSIKQFNFIIDLCTAEHVLSNIVALSTMLPGRSQILSRQPKKPAAEW